MTPEALREELAAGTLHDAYLLAGAEALLRDDALAALSDAVLAGAPADFNRDVLDGARTAPGALIDAVRALPVMAPRRLVVVREPGGRGGKALCEQIAALLAEPIAPTVLVVTASKVDKRERWVKAFARPHAVVACDGPKRARDVQAFVRAEAERQGVAIDPDAAQLLAERVGPELLLLRHEIAKAALFAGDETRVRRAHAEATACDVAEQPIWDLTDAIGEGKAGEALSVLTRILSGGAPPPVVLGALASHFRKLLRVRTGGNVPGPPFVVKKLEGQARRYAPRRLVNCLESIHEADTVLKGQGALPPTLALERLVLGLSA